MHVGILDVKVMIQTVKASKKSLSNYKDHQITWYPVGSQMLYKSWKGEPNVIMLLTAAFINRYTSISKIQRKKWTISAIFLLGWTSPKVVNMNLTRLFKQ